jgi:hypothetical protein
MDKQYYNFLSLHIPLENNVDNPLKEGGPNDEEVVGEGGLKDAAAGGPNEEGLLDSPELKDDTGGELNDDDGGEEVKDDTGADGLKEVELNDEDGGEGDEVNEVDGWDVKDCGKDWIGPP